ncbi:MAG TPA: hypothetical protein VJN70_19495 [Gemmatimonadaceae bacterium]|nr:hypothetical protein [Gemmatimonadaceae bacterium]
MAIALDSARESALIHESSTVATDAWHARAVVFAAACVMVGVYWDISWHMTIGRDTFWTPAHLLIQAGGLIAGFSSVYVALRTTFAGTPAAKAASVSFWGFRAPLGAWVCIWGCGAMLASAPFDNWWHNAYGLDVQIISPPHMILALGIVAITVGALLLTLARQNQTTGDEQQRFAMLFTIASAFWILNVWIMLSEYSYKEFMHSGVFYRVAATYYPLVLLTTARANTLRWPATKAAAIYMAVTLALMWMLQLFPAEPKLGPIYQRITHMVTMDFPILMIVPAFGLDLVRQRYEGRVRDVWLAPILGVVFVGVFIAVEWPFANFLITTHSRNWFFNGANYVYFMTKQFAAQTFSFASWQPWSQPLAPQLALAVVLATISSYIGLKWGTWMTKVRR